jgi:hypothetical protein
MYVVLHGSTAVCGCVLLCAEQGTRQGVWVQAGRALGVWVHRCVLLRLLACLCGCAASLGCRPSSGRRRLGMARGAPPPPCNIDRLVMRMPYPVRVWEPIRHQHTLRRPRSGAQTATGPFSRPDQGVVPKKSAQRRSGMKLISVSSITF